MKKLSFEQWLLNEKQMSVRSAKDVISRKKRVEKITNTTNVNEGTLEKLVESDQFSLLSMYIKSQLKRTAKLVLEYEENMNG